MGLVLTVENMVNLIGHTVAFSEVSSQIWVKGRTCKLCVLNRCDFNFCVRSSPLREMVCMCVCVCISVCICVCSCRTVIMYMRFFPNLLCHMYVTLCMPMVPV